MRVAGRFHEFRTPFQTMNFDERFSRFFERAPTLHPTAYIAPGAIVIGDVTLEEESSVWCNSVLRGDINAIRIGPRSNIQDGTVVHLADDLPTIVGEYVTCGHKAILHACTIGDEVLIGMGAIILDGVEIGARSIIGAGALVTKEKKIPPGSLVLGSPAKITRSLDREEQASLKSWAEKYVDVSRKYREAAARAAS
jgi:carbonic anhydrase/acetyltransferase-like protein (isoleucine patch superfamily)